MATNYAVKKAQVRQEAIEFQNGFANDNYSWGELAEKVSYFETQAKKYGLTTEFKENGII